MVPFFEPGTSFAAKVVIVILAVAVISGMVLYAFHDSILSSQEVAEMRHAANR